MTINLSSRQNNSLFKPIIYFKVFTPEECSKIIESEGEFKKSSVLNTYDNNQSYSSDIRNSFNKTIDFNEKSRWLFDKLIPAVMHMNKEHFNFIIDVLEETILLKYEPGGFFKWHADMGEDGISTRKLTAIVPLSKPESYKGGKLKFNLSESEAIQEQGSLIVFPSYMFHVVEPITEGLRYSMVSWFHGPHFR